MGIEPPAPPLGGEHLLVLLLAMATLLLFAVLLGRLAERLGMPAIVGELATGVLLGPSLLGHLAPGVAHWLLPNNAEQMHLLDAAALLGVLLLVGLTGTHLDVAMLRRRKAAAARISLGGLLLPLALGLAIGYLLPTSILGASGHSRLITAGFMGVAMCVTAIPVIAKTLLDMRLMHRDVGQLSLAAGSIDDAVGWALLSAVSIAAVAGITVGHVAKAVAYLLAFVLAALLVGRPLVRRVMRLAGRGDQAGPTIATAAIVILVGAAITQSLGMEPVFGAFVAGILVGLPGAADQKKLAPLRTVTMSLLAPLFLATAGLRVNLSALADPTVALVGVLVLACAVLGKFVGAYAGSRLSRLSRWESLAIGAGMNSRGVIEVVVALTGLRLGVLNVATYTILLLVAIVTSMMAPPVLRFATARIEQSEAERLRKIEQDTWDGLPASGPVASGEQASL